MEGCCPADLKVPGSMTGRERHKGCMAHHTRCQVSFVKHMKLEASLVDISEPDRTPQRCKTIRSSSPSRLYTSGVDYKPIDATWN